MLAPWAVLGEHLRPALVARHDAHASMHPVRVAADAAREQRQHDRRRAVLDDVRVRRVAHDDELVGAAGRGHAAVAEVHPEQVAVRERIRWTPQHEHMFAPRSAEGGGSRTRTWDLRFWRPALPPAELIPQ